MRGEGGRVDEDDGIISGSGCENENWEARDKDE